MIDPSAIIGPAWLTFAAIWVIAAFTTKRTVRRQPLASRIVQIVLALAAAALMVGWEGKPAFLRQVIPETATVGFIAAAMVVLGLGFAVWARFVLGRNWSGTVTIKQDHELIRTGPYSIVRHPIYTGVLFALLGTAIRRGDVGTLIGLLMVTVVLRLKSLSEETFMMEQFPAQYPVYKREVKALIPFIW